MVERRRAAAGEREADHRHGEDAPRGHARGADERRRAAGQQQQRHHARLGQRDVVVQVGAGAAGGARQVCAQSSTDAPNASEATARCTPG